MIKKYRWNILNFFVFLLIAVLLFIVQSAVWPGIFGPSATPQFWLVISVYFAVHKSPLSALLMMYCISWMYSSATQMAFGKILAINGIIILTAWILQMFNLKNMKIFILFCLGIILFFPLLDWLLSALSGESYLHPYRVFHWLAVSLLTTLWAALSAPLLIKMEHFILSGGEEESSLNKISLFTTNGRFE